MSRILGGGAAWRVSMRAAAFLVAAGAATGLPAELGFGGAAAAQERPAPSEAALGGAESAAPEGALAELFEMARSGQADRHLPFVLARLKRALADQDLLGVLELTDKSYFDAQFQRHRTPNRSPGQAMSAYACEFFSVCDISKTYGFNDIVSAEVMSVSPRGGLTGGPVEVTLELQMWDGLTLVSVIFYDPNSAKISASVG